MSKRLDWTTSSQRNGFITSMNEFEYSYCVIKYRHDRAAGEILNVGVVVYTAATGQLGVMCNPRYARLSEAFAHFDGDLYKRTMDKLRNAIRSIAERLTNNLFQIEERERFSDAGAILRTVWPDQGLCY